jgi:antitoxin component YwqK of YwqJK toxin-antitoxin module
MNKAILPVMLCIFTACLSFAETLPEIDSYKIIQKGIQLHDDKKYAEAIAEFNKVNKNDTNFVLCMLELANSYIANKQDSLAVLACDRVLFISSAYAPAVLLYKANALDNMKKTDEAIKVYEEGIRKYPLNNSFYYDLGILKFNQKKYKEANDLFITSIKYNPFDPGSHFQMGNIAILQGKIVPAMLAWSFYLTMDNSSDRAKAIVLRLEKLAQNEYQFDDAITIDGLTDQDDFSELEALVKSKVALTNKYKSKIDLNYSLTKQLQLIFEKMEVNKADQGFYMQFYAPVFSELNKRNFYEPFVYGVLSGMNIDKVNSWFKHNNSDYNAYGTWLLDYIGSNKAVFETYMNGKNTSVRHWYNGNSKIASAGNVNSSNTEIGYWHYYYPNAILKSEGAYTNLGKRTGSWKFYYPSGLVRTIETYTDGAVGGNVQSFYENGSIKTNKLYKNDMLDGTQSSYYPTGVKNTSADYKDNKENGREISYYPNSKLKYDLKVVNDNYEGELVQYYDNGHVKEKSFLKEGKRTGKSEDFYNYPENKLRAVSTYVNGIITGDYKSYYDNGKMEETGKYTKDGKKDGKWLTYYDNDTLFSEEYYSNGKVDEITRYFDINGKPTSEYNYKNNVLQDYKSFDENGKVRFTSKKDGKRDYDLLLYYPNGNRQKEGKIINNNLDGPWMFYDRNGYITDKTSYVDGVKQGKSISYYENGKIKSEQNYVDGETDGYYKEYYKDGKVMKEGPYVKDKYVGKWNYYYCDGKLQSSHFYKDDERDGWQQYFALNGKLDFEEYIELGYIKKRIQYDTTGKIMQEIVFDRGTGKMDLNFFNGKKYFSSNVKNDLTQGVATSYYPNGKVRVTQNYVDGYLDGETKFYYMNGKVEWANNFVYGKKHGLQTHYDEDGNVEEETNYYYGQLSGKSTNYYPNKQIKYISNYRNNDLEGERLIYDESGDLVIKRIYHNGYLIGYTYMDKSGGFVPVIPVKNETGTVKAFFKNGSPSIEYTLKRGFLDGKRTVYFPDGKIKTEELYASGDQYGLEKDYYPSGKIKAEENWNNDKKDGKSVYYYENGKVKSEEYYFDGSEHGDFKSYDQNGKLAKTYVYYNGYLVDEK